MQVHRCNRRIEIEVSALTQFFITGDDNIVRVSPYRLASHLLGAFTIYAGMVWTGLSVLPHQACVHSKEPASR